MRILSFNPLLPRLALGLLCGLLLARLLPAANYKWDTLPIGGGGLVSGIITSKTVPDLRYVRTDVGGAYRWDEPTGKWIALNDWTTSTDKGYTSVESLAIDELNPQNVYMFVGVEYYSNGRSAILRSSDYGETFEIVEVTDQFRAHGNGFGRTTGERLQVDPNNSNILYCATRHQGLFRSEDAGRTWSRLTSLPVTELGNDNGIDIVVIDPDSAANGRSQTLFVGVCEYGKTLYRSDDAGATFTPVTGGPNNLFPQRAALASDGNLFITYGNGYGPSGITEFPLNTGALWKYNVDTETWTNVTPLNRTHAFGGISVDPANPQRLIASSSNTWWTQEPGRGGDRFYLSNDGGASWTDLVDRGYDMDPNGVTWQADIRPSIHWAGCIEFDPFDTTRALVISGNGLFLANDLDAQTVVWTSNVDGIEETASLALVSLKDGPTFSAIGDYDGFRHTGVDTYAPVHQPTMGTTTDIVVAAQNTDILARVGSRLYLTSDQGLTWSQTPQTKGTKGKLALSADGSTLLHSPENSSTTYRSTDNGASWTTVSGLSVQNARPVADSVNSQKFYVADGNRLYRSDNGGASFAAKANLPWGGIKRLSPMPEREGDIWLTIAPQPWEGASDLHGLYRSTDSGATFTQIPGISSAQVVGSGKAAPGKDYPTLYIWGTIDGVEGAYRSTDQGTSWLRINDDAHQYGGPGNAEFIVGDPNVFGRVYMATNGRGFAYGEPMLDSISYTAWIDSLIEAFHFTDPSIFDESSDTDGDGLTNLVEWILQTDPLFERTDLTARTFAFSANAPSIVIEQLAQLESATLIIEVSTDLQTWTNIEDTFIEQPSDPEPDSLTRSRSFLPAGGVFPQTIFLRVSAHR